MVVGAHALAVAGRPRATQDLDIFVEPSSENADRLGCALRAFGFPALAAESHRFAEPDRMATLGQPPLQIDVMTSITGLSFEAAFATRVTVTVGDTVTSFLGREGLIANKSAAARTKDKLDIALLSESDPE